MKEESVIALMFGFLFFGIAIGGVELPFQKEGNVTPENDPLYTNNQDLDHLP